MHRIDEYIKLDLITDARPCYRVYELINKRVDDKLQI